MTVLADKNITDMQWSKPDRSARECTLWMHVDEDGGYSVSSPSLPGLVAEGDTIPDALNNAREAAKLLITLYLNEGSIPWQKAIEPAPSGVIERRIVVHD